jgi:hypothetical protein
MMVDVAVSEKDEEKLKSGDNQVGESVYVAQYGRHEKK